MPHESSAVADLVSLAHREPIHASPDPGDPRRGGPGPGGGGSGLSATWIVLIGTVVIGASIAGGYFMARQDSPAAASEMAENTPEATPIAESKAAGSENSEEGEADASELQIEPEADSEAGEVDIELAKVTGFDVLVQPSGAKVSLDGQAIGAAPLRVRNLLPGKHAIDIEGPEGYFGKHLEFDLQAGEAEVLNLVLQATGDSQEPASEDDDEAVALAEHVDAEDSDEDEDEGQDAEKEEGPANKTSNKGANKSQSKAGKSKREQRRLKANAAEEKILNKAAQIALGTLMLGAKPPCDIIINGKKTGLVTPQRAIQLPEGSHRVVLVNAKFNIRKSFKVNIKAGRTTRAIQDLSAEL